MQTRRQFVIAGAAGATGAVAGSRVEGEIQPGNVPELRPPFRLSKEWHQAAVRRFQVRLAEKGLAGAIVSDVLNRNYLTGIFLTETERPNFLFVPAQGEPVAFIPGLDKDMAASWWVKEYEWYFDYPHAGHYGQVAWKAGAREDLFIWMLKGIARRGWGKG